MVPRACVLSCTHLNYSLSTATYLLSDLELFLKLTLRFFICDI